MRKTNPRCIHYHWYEGCLKRGCDCDNCCLGITEEERKKRIIGWLFNGETGTSSKTIAASVLRVNYEDADIPYDKDDFSRCYKLVKLAEIPLSELKILAERYPKWGPIVENWEQLICRYESDEPMYGYLKELCATSKTTSK
jgi:hypothetical protein